MLILALDTSTRNCSLALLQDSEVLVRTGGVSAEPYAARLFADLSRILSQAGLELPQIELFAAGVGPGSFTGLRVGLAAVKGWAEAFERPIAAVSVLEAIAVQAQPAGRLLAPVLDARGGQVFGGLFRRPDASGGLKAVAEEVVMAPGQYFEWVAGMAGGERPLFVSSTPEAVGPELRGSAFGGAVLEAVSGELAPWIGRLALERSRRGEVVDALSLDANYVRRSDAEAKWGRG